MVLIDLCMRNILLNRNARWLVPLVIAPLLILLANSSIAGQTDIRVTGKVTDKATNTGLPGVTVQVKGTNTGTVTDATGTYSIQVTENATLVFSSIGFVKSEVPVGGRTEINVTLE
jgi:hypothetical protein